MFWISQSSNVVQCVLPACVLRSIFDDKEVDDPGGEVQGHVCFTVDHCDAMPVPITGPRHTTTKQQEWWPTHTFMFRLVCPNDDECVTMCPVTQMRNKVTHLNSEKLLLHVTVESHWWIKSTYPSFVGSWTILEMALQGKCPATKDRKVRKPFLAHRYRRLCCGRFFLLTIWNVGFLLFLIHILSAHDPLTITSITVRTENVASIIRPPHTLKLLWLQWKHT